MGAVAFLFLSAATAQDAVPLSRTSASMVFSLTATPGTDPQHPARVALSGPDGVLLYGLHQPAVPEHLLLLDSGALITVDGPEIALYDSEGAQRWSLLAEQALSPTSWRHEDGAILLATVAADTWVQVRLSDGHLSQIRRRYLQPSVEALLAEADHAPPARAAELTRRALAADTAHIGAWVRLIRALQQTGRHSPALSSADIAFQVPAPDPEQADWLVYRQLYTLKADSARLLQGTVEAETILRDGLLHSPGDPVIRGALAAGMIDSNRVDEARALFAAGTDAVALAEAGDFFAAQGLLAVAEDYYQRLADASGAPAQMGRLALLYRERQDYDAAVSVRTAQLARLEASEDSADWREAVLGELDALEAARQHRIAQAN